MCKAIEALRSAIFSLTLMADELAEAAHNLSHQPSAGTLLILAQRCRVEALKQQGRLVGMEAEYAKRFGTG